MPYTINGKEIKPYVDFDEFDYHQFYDTLRGGTVPTTSALSPLEYVEIIEPEFKAGNDILYVHFSSQMSGTFNAMNIALNVANGVGGVVASTTKEDRVINNRIAETNSNKYAEKSK